MFGFQKLLAMKSSKIAKQLQKNPEEDLGRLLRDIPGDEESMDVVARFCHGFEIKVSTENVVRVACVAHYLGMTETHCKDNLLNKAFLFFDKHIIHSWTNSIKALNTADTTVFRQAEELGLIKCCFETLILKALDHPHLLGDPIIDDHESDDDEKPYNKPSTRRKLFDNTDEDLTSLPLRLYAPIIHSMMLRQVPLRYVAASICKYAQAWLFCKQGFDHHHHHQKEIIEALVMLLPHKTAALIHCKFLCEMLRFAISVDAGHECRDGLEMRIGLQLVEASAKDLLIIPCQGYANDDVYDAECLRRILKHFYTNYTGSDPTALPLVAELMEDFLAEIAADVDLKTATFIAVAEMSMAAAEAASDDQRSSNGTYKAVDVYLDKHRHLIDSEKEELCKLLDFNKLSAEALQHAAMNERLPVRVVVQALFATSLKIRDAIPAAAAPKAALMQGDEGEEEMRTEMEKMGSKVSELERECVVMRREMERGGKREKKVSVWKEMKRKFGCMTSMHDCDCHVNKKMKKKVHPRLL